MNFNWKDVGQDDFLKWLVPHLLTGEDEKKQLELSEATEGFTNVELTMQINGIEVDASHVIERFNQNIGQFVIGEIGPYLQAKLRFEDFTDLFTKSYFHMKASIEELLGEK